MTSWLLNAFKRKAVLREVKRSPEYQAIAEFYNTRKAARSQVPLINHINEGLEIMYRAGADVESMRAYALHPLVQDDDELKKIATFSDRGFSPMVVAYAMHYREVANAWLSDKVSTEDGHIFYACDLPVILLDQVKLMLIGDKVQNYKDFMLYHQKTHQRTVELQAYFEKWLDQLGIDHEYYLELTEGL